MALFGNEGNIMGEASQQATKAIGYRPPNLDVYGIGSVGFTTDKVKGLTGVTTNIDPVTQALQTLLSGGAGGAVSAGQGMVPQIGQAGQGFLTQGQGALAALGSFDPMAAARERYAALTSALAPQRATDQSALESRLLAQGRLDSTGGAAQLQAAKQAQDIADAQLLNSQFGEAQSAQMNLANAARGLTQTGTDIGSGLFQLGLTQAQGAQALANPLLQLLQLSGNLGTQNLAGLQARNSAISGYNAAQPGTGNPITGALGAAAGGLLGGLAGPLGAAAGAKFGAGLFGNSAPISPGASAAAYNLYDPITRQFG